ncbi:Astra associated protein 1 Asa1 [Coemansia helicoidea]|uniref:Astra associated protein 1 Asa1 n=1 Tax=Coemansia helicoidea TaxID=1286919 RepID=A0ACC1LBC0_9FUNG|nr:Astra associated protein 1 Asa1 [Coemansia helicoidea]
MHSQPDFVFRGHRAAVNAVHFFAGDRILASGDQDGVLILWSMPLKRQLVAVPDAHSAAILAVGSAGANTVVSQGRDDVLKIWALSADAFGGSLQLAASLPVDSMTFCRFSIASSAAGAWVAALEKAGSGSAFVYDVAHGTRRTFSVARASGTRMGSREDAPTCLRLTARDDGCLDLHVGYEGTAVRRYRLDTSPAAGEPALVWEAQTAHQEPIMGVDVDAASECVYTCAADGQVCCIAAGPSGAPEVRAAGALPSPGAAEIRCFESPPLVAVAGWDYAVHLFTRDLAPAGTVRFHRAALTSVDMSTQSAEPLPGDADDLAQQRWRARPQWLAVASRDARVSLWGAGNVTSAR